MQPIAIYDLDRTLLKHATYTPFLLFAARRRSPLRLLLAPGWIAAMVAYKAGMMSRAGLKQLGLALFLGRRLTESELTELGEAFADAVLPSWIGVGAQAALARDRGEGRRLVLATAAFGFYAGAIGRRLGFDHVVATGHTIGPDEPGTCRIAGSNCYGTQKVPRIAELLSGLGMAREDCHLRFYSDSLSDAPLLRWCDEAVLVDAGSRARAIAAREGWATARFAR